MSIQYYMFLIDNELKDLDKTISIIKKIGYYIDSDDDLAYETHIIWLTCEKLEIYCRALRDKLNESEIL